MNGREMNASSGPGRDRQRSWPRWAAALAAMALVGPLATACGGGSSPTASAAGGSTSGAGGSTRQQTALAYAACMRTHGAPNFPDPDNNGNFNLGSNQQGGGSKENSNSVTPQESAANQVCNHLLATGSQLSAAQTQHALGQLVKYAQCMRSHGVPNFRDPHITTGEVGQPSGISFDMTGINQNSPQYMAAQQACQSLSSTAKG